jgi:hypothetical protein
MMVCWFGGIMESTISRHDPDNLDLGPFHGEWESAAKFFTLTVLIGSACLIAFPWILGLISAHHQLRYSVNAFPHSSARLVLLDFWGVLLASSYYSIYRRLSARISEGGPESPFLDLLRFTLAFQGFIALNLAAYCFIFCNAFLKAG